MALELEGFGPSVLEVFDASMHGTEIGKYSEQQKEVYLTAGLLLFFFHVAYQSLTSMSEN